MDEENGRKFYELCLKVPDAVLCGRYISQYDKILNESIMPSANWLRDDDIGGLRQLNEVFDYLEKNNLVEEAIADKELSVKMWREIKELFAKIEIPQQELREFIGNSIEYGLCFFKVVEVCFKIMAKCRKNENTRELLREYDEVWSEYKGLEQKNQASTSYNLDYKFGKDGHGFDEDLKYCRANLC